MAGPATGRWSNATSLSPGGWPNGWTPPRTWSCWPRPAQHRRFRYAPPGFAGDLDALNDACVGAAVNDDGRVMFGTTRYRGMTAFRPAITNWRTTEADVDLIADVVREVGRPCRLVI